MSIFFVKDKAWWRYDFVLKGNRYTKDGFKTKAKAKKAEAKRREAIETQTCVKTLTDMGFLDLANRRLDYIKAYNSPPHYRDNFYRFRRWIEIFGHKNCSELTSDMIEKYLLKRLKQTSAVTVNSEVKNLRALFNYGIKKKLIKENPTRDIEFFPVEKKVKNVPPLQDVSRVLLVAEPDEQDYLYALRETLARKNEIDNLKWSDVNFEERCVILYTRKKKSGHQTPRKVPMTDLLFEILSRRYKNRNKDKPYVF